MNILLLGGNGFLGKGLQKELIKRNIQFQSIDINDIDLSDRFQIPILVEQLKNYSHIVILASKIGIDIFETDPVNASNYNRKIYNNIKLALQIASSKFNKSFDVTYYSTSEVYGSLQSKDDFILDNSQYNFDFNNPRHLYAYVKYEVEKDLFKINELNPFIISNVKIIRPFNIYGMNQKRGVVYKMIKSALTTNKITYCEDTTRTFTDIILASKLALDAILKNKNVKVNLIDPLNSLSLKSLAIIINEVLNLKCELINIPFDKSIQYRHISKVDDNIDLSKRIMKPFILDLAYQISDEKTI